MRFEVLKEIEKLFSEKIADSERMYEITKKKVDEFYARKEADEEFDKEEYVFWKNEKERRRIELWKERDLFEEFLNNDWH